MNTQMLANTEYFGCDVGLSWNQHPTTSAGDIRKIAINESDPRHGARKDPATVLLQGASAGEFFCFASQRKQA
jgi:hypothetical protein